jgi:hypothetical protein
MDKTRAFLVLVTVTAVAMSAACGGGGHGFAAPADPLVISGASLPATQSGQTVDWMIPVSGGCGGPYVVSVIDGALPRGVGTDDAAGRHHLTGVVLESGLYAFTLQVVDTSCEPFLTTTHAYTWQVDEGPLTIVGANPPLIPVASYDDPQRWTDVDAVPKTVYGQFTSWSLVVAGGTPPYACALYDDPVDPDDGGLPLGTSLTVNGCSVVGTPSQVGPNGRPFRLSLRVTDAVGHATTRKLQWKIDTPAIVVASATLMDGRAGKPYADVIQLIDGVPPFRFEFLDDVPSVPDDQVVYGAPNAPTFPSATGFTVSTDGGASNRLGPGGGSSASYPAPGDAGPTYAPFPSEGMYLVGSDAGAGSVLGLPRRAGTFTTYLHAYSALVPNERGQHAFRTVSFHILPSDPPAGGDPAFGFNPAFTVEKSLAGTPSLPDFEVGQTYNPDAATHPPAGLQLLAQGGVPADGWTDAPHLSQRVMDFTEMVGGYQWSANWDPDSVGAPNPPAGIVSDANGLVNVTVPGDLVRSGAKPVTFAVSDYQLPTSIRNATTGRFQYSVGPDIVIITQSTQSLTQNVSYYSASQRHEWNDTQLTIRKFEAYSSGPQRNALDGTDLPAEHEVPSAAGLDGAANPLGALLSGATGGDSNLDLLRCVVNATGWWDDLHGMNPNGARPFAHCDPNRSYAYYGEFGISYSYMGNWQPPCSAVDLPDALDVPGGPDPSHGVYTDGGRLYHWESASRFGVFIIRADGRISVPFAMEKDSTIAGFGDGVLETKNNTDRNSSLRTVQMTVSPDGRFAAMKLKKSPTFLYEHASDSRLLLFSLTGEKVFDGATYTIVDTGVSLTGTGNRIAYASSMALTNRYLYFLIGTRSAASSGDTSVAPLYYQSWSGHYLMRYEILGGASAAHLLPGTDSEWTQAGNVPMQTVFHDHGPDPYTSPSGLIESTTSYGRYPYHLYWQQDGMNFQEHNLAPAPFRVSRNGLAVAFFAASDYYGTSSTLVYSNYAWVDFDGSGARRITTARRHHASGSARGYSSFQGPDTYGSAWGRFSGPTPGVEISDDGLQVAFVFNTYTGSMVASYSYSSSTWRLAREDLLLCRTTAADQWATLASTTQDAVTAQTFAGSHFWRFGCLAFTQDGTGLVFWGGAPVYISNTTSYWYEQSFQTAGAFYVHDVTATHKVVSMLAADEGGSPATEGTTYTSSSPFNPSSTSGLDNRFGAIQPYGGFLSRNRQFMYVVSLGAMSASDGTACKLVGMNISTINAGSINGHPNGRGFVPANWPSRRGFIGNYVYYPYYPMYYGYAPDNQQGAGLQVMAKDTGWVFWGAGWQYTGPSNYYYYGGPVYTVYYYGCYGYGGVGIYGFNADVGGAVAQLNNPSLTQDTTGVTEMLNFLEVSADGSRLTYTTTSNYYLFYKDQEYVNQVRHIDFSSPTGQISPSFNPSADAGRLESTPGRAGEAVGISASSNDTYYAFKAGASDEAAKEIVRARVDPATNGWTLTRYNTLTGRMSVLYATR